MKKISLIAQFPPPIHGLSKAVDTIVKSRLSDKYIFEVINITNNKLILKSCWRILKSSSAINYFTISQTKSGLWRDILLMFLMWLKQKPYIVHLHGGYLRILLDKDCPVFQRRLVYNLLSKARACIVLGESLRYIFEGICRRTRILVVPNCIDNDFSLSLGDFQVKMENVLKQNRIHVLYLSNFIPTKGYREVLEVAKIINAESQSSLFEFHFAGKFFNEEEKEYFKSFVESNELSDIVRYHGIVSGDDKRELLKLCNVFMLLTRYPNEGQPISILEAMGNAMTIVTTDHAGIPDIANEDNGYVLPKNDIDVNKITEYLFHCANNRKLFRDVCLLNYDIAQKSYNEDTYIKNIETVFDSF